MSFLKEMFAWWTGATIGTRVFTWRKGEFVAEDEYGNRYYRERGGDRRWVIYRDVTEASKVPPGWNGWLHHTTDVAPSEQDYEPRPWEKDHMPNPTGTGHAIRPPGSILTEGHRPRTTGDYEPWTPESS